MTRSLHISDDGSLHRYRTEIPNTFVRGNRGRGLPPTTKWLYVYLKSIAGDRQECWQSTTSLAEGSGLGRGTVSRARRQLVKQGLIIVTPGSRINRDTMHIRIVDIWHENMQEFAVPRQETLPEDQCSTMELQYSTMELQCSTVEHQQPIDNTEEDNSSVPPWNSGVPPWNSGVPNRALKKIPKKKIPKKEENHRVSLGRHETPSSSSHDAYAGEDRLTPEGLMDLYNTQAPPSLPRVKTLSPARRKKALLYLRLFPHVSFWQTVMGELGQSSFLMGLKPSPGHEHFQGGLDWILTKGRDGTENCVKVFEGKFRDGPQTRHRKGEHDGHRIANYPSGKYCKDCQREVLPRELAV